MIGRYELKYIIDSATRASFLREAQHGLIADPNGQNAIYRVSSVYFDTPDFSAYWEKLDGEGVRRKYRLRYYTPDSADQEIGTAYMEIKHRVQNTVYKQRVQLTEAGALAILNNGQELAEISKHVAPTANLDLAAIADIERAAQHGLEAKTTITYLREAWLGSVDDRLRLTFDSQGQTYSSDAFARVDSNSGQNFMPDDQIIMEVKFNQAIPRWIRDVLVKQQLVLHRFSKYAAGVAIPAQAYMRSLSST